MPKDKLKFSLWFVSLTFAALILFLSYQNVQLKKTAKIGRFDASQAAKFNAYTFEDGMDSNFLFKKFPIEIDLNTLIYSTHMPETVVNGYVFVVFDLTVCGNCLKKEMKVLMSFVELLSRKNIAIIAIIGVADKNEKADLVSLRQSGHIFYPCHIVPVEEIYENFNLNKNVFLDTPFYFYANHESVVLNIFKPTQESEEELTQWLKILSNQELY